VSIYTKFQINVNNKKKNRWHAVSAVGSGTMLQAGKSLIRFPVRSLKFLIDVTLPAATMDLGSTQPLTEMSTRNLPVEKWRPAHKVDKLTTICEPIV
jgi:hypothetical protein